PPGPFLLYTMPASRSSPRSHRETFWKCCWLGDLLGSTGLAWLERREVGKSLKAVLSLGGEHRYLRALWIVKNYRLWIQSALAYNQRRSLLGCKNSILFCKSLTAGIDYLA